MRGEDPGYRRTAGTGKSQTITNMISAAMAQGKKVLFVAEKTRCLGGGKKNRLTRAAWVNFCLELATVHRAKRAQCPRASAA